MKIITMSVPDDQVGAIIGLVAELVDELSVTHVKDSPSTPVTSGKRRSSPGTRLKAAETRLGRLVMEQFPVDGTKVLKASIEEAIVAGGFKASSLSAITSQLVAQGAIHRIGADHLQRAIKV
jgi:hypothetical protein